jgi:hypothetical protein
MVWAVIRFQGRQNSQSGCWSFNLPSELYQNVLHLISEYRNFNFERNYEFMLQYEFYGRLNSLKAELNPICHLLIL